MEWEILLTIVLLIALAMLLSLNWFFLGKDPISPAVLLVAVFCFSVADGVITSYEKWGLDIDASTCFSILFACCAFSLGCYSIHVALGEKRIMTRSSERYSRRNLFKINTPILVIIALLQIVVYFFVQRKIDTIVASYTGALAYDRTGSTAGVYDQLSKYSSVDTSLGVVLDTAFSLCTAIPNVLGFVLIWNYLIVRKANIRYQLSMRNLFLFINILLGILGSMITGGRSGAIWTLLSITVMFVIIRRGVTGRKANALKLKYVVGFVMAGIIIIPLFYYSLALVGRATGGFSSVFDTLNVYLGAPIKNFDTFMRTNIRNPGSFGAESLKSLYGFLGIDTHSPGISVEHRYYQGHWLGNVTTMLASLNYDFGLLGTVLVMFILGLFSQFIFEKALSDGNEINTALSVVVYGYITRGIVFAFFDNLFTTSIISIGFICKVLLWFVVLKMCFNSQTDCWKATGVMRQPQINSMKQLPISARGREVME
ncbi:O-antigen polymerase [Bifidobacterium sp.]|uniref:O-antigen polymerase n=1 Tax=Bifidobacterium sp. TaxID=41200 RepID=UPI0025C1EDD4|nr:O-antigen polymerase [Bifidobacterium sp.]MCI1634764.1 oligosaccharide repeat unit polymerase [Bifidobacterium sp.]